MTRVGCDSGYDRSMISLSHRILMCLCLSYSLFIYSSLLKSLLAKKKTLFLKLCYVKFSIDSSSPPHSLVHYEVDEGKNINNFDQIYKHNYVYAIC